VNSKSGKKEKFLVTFPYPYMNGRLHLGHAFSLTKAEFSARFQRLAGKQVLFPFGFHCTGMPIQAAADNLRRELEKEAAGAVDEGEVNDASDDEEEVEEAAADKPAAAAGADGPKTAFRGKKSKAKAKVGSGVISHSSILRSCGVPDDLISKFVDPQYWLQYFPPLGLLDLQRYTR
jgi:leucyl-tRNA synthetase